MELKEQIFNFFIEKGFEPHYVGLHGNPAYTPENFAMQHKTHPIVVQGTFDDSPEFIEGNWANYYVELSTYGKKHREWSDEVYYQWQVEDEQCTEELDGTFKSFEEIKKDIEQVFHNWDIKI